MTLQEIKNKVNWREPKYMLPAILYPLLLGTGWLVFDMFDTKLAETPTEMQTTEYLNPELPQAQLRTDAIGGKYENMAKSYGKIQDYSAVENIEQNYGKDFEEYDSKYTDADLALLDEEAARRLQEMQEALENSRDKGLEMSSDSLLNLSEEERLMRAGQRNQEALDELNKALAEARLKGQQAVDDGAASLSIDGGATIETNENAVHQPSDDAQVQEVSKAKKPNSSYFNTLAENEPEPRLIKAIIDENIKAVDGSRVRLRLLDDVEINGVVLEKGSYMYAIMSGFGQQRVKGNVKSLMVDDELVKVNLTLYDTDGLEGLYVPSSSFRETTQDIASSALSSNMSLNNGNYSNSFSQWGMQAIQNAYQQTTGAISKAIRKNKANLKYGTFVYLVNSRDANN